jgi:hypothetical protein
VRAKNVEAMTTRSGLEKAISRRETSSMPNIETEKKIIQQTADEIQAFGERLEDSEGGEAKDVQKQFQPIIHWFIDFSVSRSAAEHLWLTGSQCDAARSS